MLRRVYGAQQRGFAQVQSLAQRWGKRSLRWSATWRLSAATCSRSLVADGGRAGRRAVQLCSRSGANPNLASELPDRLRLLAAGEDLAAARLAQFRQEQTLYQEKLARRRDWPPRRRGGQLR